jgi:metal-responsive CopG/Arc/MetJ family transcriptional regulator
MDRQIRIAVRVPQALKDRFQALCAERAINSSELVRQLIVSWISEQEQGYSKRATDIERQGE